ncbi:hypothetical protein HMPREF0649_00923 [Segatella buccae D17]|nr:hypothetical protein HMPREF0649_00923 [Segatella buccae D17]
MTKDVDMTKRPKVRWKYKIAVWLLLAFALLFLPAFHAPHRIIISRYCTIK